MNGTVKWDDISWMLVKLSPGENGQEGVEEVIQVAKVGGRPELSIRRLKGRERLGMGEHIAVEGLTARDCRGLAFALIAYAEECECESWGV